jgi:hypothetical protein
VIARWGEDALERSAIVEWDVTPPSDRTKDAAVMSGAATALSALRAALREAGVELDVPAFAVRFGIPLKEDTNADGRLDSEDTQLAEVIPIYDEDDAPIQEAA